jgi:hypothetical protein
MGRMVFTTLLPAAAAIKYRHTDYDAKALIAAVKDYCITEISQLSQMRDERGLGNVWSMNEQWF